MAFDKVLSIWFSLAMDNGSINTPEGLFYQQRLINKFLRAPPSVMRESEKSVKK
jgi:hypothetical protein